MRAYARRFFAFRNPALIALLACALVSACGGGSDNPSAQAASGTATVAQGTGQSSGGGPSPGTAAASVPGTSMAVQTPANDTGSAPTVSLSLASSSVAPGQITQMNWSSTNATACTASGTWTGPEPASGTVAVSQSQAGNFAYILTCSGPGGDASASVQLAVLAGLSNVAAVAVDGGPPNGRPGGSFNVPFVDVTICKPGTTTCQTIDHVMIDSGSYGFRVMASELDPSMRDLPGFVNGSGAVLGECAHFGSGFMWGSVRTADVRIAGETASKISIEVVGDTATPFAKIPAACADSGVARNSVATFGGKGILGIGIQKFDCGQGCTSSAAFDTYFACQSGGGCTSTTLQLEIQVSNPVASFATDNNGVMLSLPPVPLTGAATLSGSLVFGIGTQANNQLGAAKVFPASASARLNTIYKGRTFTESYIDSGSNGILFSDGTVEKCNSNPGSLYCPGTPFTIAASVQSAAGGAPQDVSLPLVNPRNIDLGVRAASIGGEFDAITFGWGLPFYFGRSVFSALEGAQTSGGKGPYWAF